MSKLELPELVLPICPECGNDDVIAEDKDITIKSNVDIKTLEIDIVGLELNNFYYISEFHCPNCDHDWEDETNSKNIGEAIEQRARSLSGRGKY